MRLYRTIEHWFDSRPYRSFHNNYPMHVHHGHLYILHVRIFVALLTTVTSANSIFLNVRVEATSTAGATAFLFFFGISSGGFISIMASCFMSLSENVSEIGYVTLCLSQTTVGSVLTKPRGCNSLRAGTGFLFVAMGALCGSPIAGAILKASGGGYFAPCCFGGGCALMGCALLVAARRTQVVRIGSAKV